MVGCLVSLLRMGVFLLLGPSLLATQTFPGRLDARQKRTAKKNHNPEISVLLHPLPCCRIFTVMITDAPPRRKNANSFRQSDRLDTLPLPPDSRLSRAAVQIETAMHSGRIESVRATAEQFLNLAADFYRVHPCDVRVLAARPLRVREYSTSELFGDYHPHTRLIRVWMKTAIRKEITSFGTFLSTLCHEFCHHLDFERFGYRDSWHTRGFYERTGALYHHAKGTPRKRIVWMPVRGRRFRINWSRTNCAPGKQD